MSLRTLRKWRAAGSPVVIQRRGHSDIDVGGVIVYGAGNAGAFYPTDSNTGVPGDQQATTAANVISGDVTITTSGTAGAPFIYQNKTVNGRIFVNADYVEVRYCKITGNLTTPYSGADTALIVVKDGQVGIKITQNTLDGAKASVYLNGIRGANFTATRNRIKNVVDWCDGFRTGTANDTVDLQIHTFGNYLSDLTYISPDPNHVADNRTHNDGIQIPQNGGVYMTGDRVEAYASTTRGSGYDGLAAPTASNPYAPSVTGQCLGITTTKFIWNPVQVDGCWFAAGAQSITWIKGSPTGTFPTTNFIRNCVFTKNSNPSVSKGGVAMRRPILIDTLIPIQNFPAQVQNLTGVLDTDIASGGSNNRYDDGTFIPIVRMDNAG